MSVSCFGVVCKGHPKFNSISFTVDFALNSSKLTILRRLRALLLSWLMGQEQTNPLEQTTCEKWILNVNLILILSGAIFLYVYFSINPFSTQEIAELQANLNMTIH